MTITSNDLRVMQSERMTDYSDGGGRMSARPVRDGVIGNVFPDISTLNTITGNVSLRKVFLNVNTANTDPYLGVFGFLSDPPLDPLVSALAFNTASATDTRTEARSYVENYRVKANKSQFILYGNHVAGQSSVQVYCREEIPSPDIGDVLCLSVESLGFPASEQYVAVQEVMSRRPVKFWDTSGEFQRDVMLLRISAPLVQNFPGRDDPIPASTAAPTVIRETQVSAAARYYGVLPLKAPAPAGALAVQVDSPYTQVVPTATAESPVVDQRAGLGQVALIQSGPAGAIVSTVDMSAPVDGGFVRYLGGPVARGSISIQTSVGRRIRDDGAGALISSPPGITGEVEYQTGRIYVEHASSLGHCTVTATPAGALLEQSYSWSAPVTAANRNTVYVFQLDANLAPGSVVLDYLALGEWIRLRDNGSGNLEGGTNQGSGTINYATGSVSVTLGALPDVDSDIVLSWGTDLRARNSSGEITVPPPEHVQALSQSGLEPGSLVMRWESQGQSRTAQANAAGRLTGDATGSVDFASGVVRFTTVHAADAQIEYAYNYDTGVHVEVFNPNKIGNQINVTLSHAPIRPGSLRCTWLANYAQAYGTLALTRTGRVVDLADDGSGQLKLPAVSDNHGAVGFVGTVNYSNGALAVDVDATLPTWVPGGFEWRTLPSGGTCGTITGWSLENRGYTFESGAAFTVRYQAASGGTVSHSESHDLPAIVLRLGRGAAGPAVPGSVRFSFRGKTYVDRAGGLYCDIDPRTNTGTLAGSYDYASNTATLTVLGSTPGNTVSIVSLLTRYTNPGVSAVLFRAPGSPLRAGSFTIRATALDGEAFTAVADINGKLTAPNIVGRVDWDSGMARVAFGEWITAAGNESEPWFDPAAVVAGRIFKPRLVDPASIFFGCVIYKSLPLDPSIVGIDPVRLPSDGRVLALRPGDVAVVHHTVETIEASPQAGAVVDLGRPRLAWAQVVDSAGTPVESVWYTLDLAAGRLTWASPLNLSAYTLPITIRHRIEDARLCTDVQVNGDISLQAPLSHDFPAGSQISGGIAYGDRQARPRVFFDQGTWDNVWRDDVHGAVAGASYNSPVYPVEVTNDGAIDERWALVFVNPNQVNVIGETTGQVLAAAPINTDIAPINPVSGKPYFTLRAAGFGTGWAAMNVIRFNTISATVPTWLARVIRPGTPTVTTDRTRIQYYGNAN